MSYFFYSTGSYNNVEGKEGMNVLINRSLKHKWKKQDTKKLLEKRWIIRGNEWNELAFERKKKKTKTRSIKKTATLCKSCVKEKERGRSKEVPHEKSLLVRGQRKIKQTRGKTK